MLLDTTKITFAIIAFIEVIIDEVTSIKNMQWLSIHLYMVQNWKRIPILLCVDPIMSLPHLTTYLL